MGLGRQVSWEACGAQPQLLEAWAQSQQPAPTHCACRNHTARSVLSWDPTSRVPRSQLVLAAEALSTWAKATSCNCIASLFQK